MGEHPLGRIVQREPRSRASAIVAAICRSGKGGEPPSWPGLTISIPIEAELRSLSPFQCALPACQARSLSGDELIDPPVLPDEIMRRDFRGRIDEQVERRLAGRHAGIVQDEAVRPPVSPAQPDDWARRQTGRRAGCRGSAQTPSHRHGRACPGHPRGHARIGAAIAPVAKRSTLVASLWRRIRLAMRGWPGQARP